MYVHGSHIPGILVAPHHVQQILPAVHLVGIEYQQFQHIKFLGGQIDFPARDKHSSTLAVQLQISHFHHLGLLLLGCGL